MADEIADKKCDCGYPVTVGYACEICDLVNRYAVPPSRDERGNISNSDIRSWMSYSLRRALQDMATIMRADLDTLAKKWSPPPPDDSTRNENQP